MVFVESSFNSFMSSADYVSREVKDVFNCLKNVTVTWFKSMWLLCVHIAEIIAMTFVVPNLAKKNSTDNDEIYYIYRFKWQHVNKNTSPHFSFCLTKLIKSAQILSNFHYLIESFLLFVFSYGLKSPINILYIKNYAWFSSKLSNKNQNITQFDS